MILRLLNFEERIKFSGMGGTACKCVFQNLDLPNPAIKPRSPALQADSFLSEPPGKPVMLENLENIEGHKSHLEIVTLNFLIYLISVLWSSYIYFSC